MDVYPLGELDHQSGTFEKDRDNKAVPLKLE
jgi:hypothetical protein